MTIDQYRHYTAQRELLLVDALAAKGKPSKGGRLPAKCTLTVADGLEYKVTPIEQETVAAYRKRFMQLDAAVKGMLGRTGTLEPITVTMQGKIYHIDPTPDQQRELDSRKPKSTKRYIETIAQQMGVDLNKLGQYL